MTEYRSTAFYESLAVMEKIHLHGGMTVLRFEDPICFACGADLFLDEIVARHCYGCGAGQGPKLHMEARPDPSLGSWSPAMSIGGKGGEK